MKQKVPFSTADLGNKARMASISGSDTIWVITDRSLSHCISLGICHKKSHPSDVFIFFSCGEGGGCVCELFYNPSLFGQRKKKVAEKKKK
jgi:hypothetical protein